jgi:hypothetical protein
VNTVFGPPSIQARRMSAVNSISMDLQLTALCRLASVRNDRHDLELHVQLGVGVL